MKHKILNYLIIFFISLTICSCGTKENKNLESSTENNQKHEESLEAPMLNNDFENEDSINQSVTYPDFITKNRYTLNEIRDFCSDFNIILEVEYKENSNYPSGTILNQSRAYGTKVVPGTILKLTIAK